ncbi:MAG TPA: ABC transporter ATP-binding protein [Planctomycetota bacterium]|nr:ABC transporter ATP-binding protein [Planctomycetota bacterium]
MSVLSVEGLRVSFDTPRGRVQALEDVSLQLEEGQTLGLVGESGSGKSVTAHSILRLLPPGARYETGSVRFDGRELLTLSERELRAVRGREIALVFQDPLASLDPLCTIGRQLEEVLEVHTRASRVERRRRVCEALAEVGLPAPDALLRRFPHELSGGQRQRAVIAMAILCRPRVLLADEPTTALDVTLQAAVLDLFDDLRARHGTAILLVTHDLGVVARAAQRVAVIYHGRVVEEATAGELFATPLHPYTLGLLAAMPRLDAPLDRPPRPMPGAAPERDARIHGCAFEPRCPFRVRRCATDRPPLSPWRPGAERAARLAGLHFLGGRRAACFESERVAAVRAGQVGEGRA